MKKLSSILALTGVVANLGFASMVFAQATATGSQTINCPDPGTISNVYDFQTAPDNFSFTTVPSPTLNEVFAAGTFEGEKSVVISSEASADCIATNGGASYDYGVKLSVNADNWTDGSDPLNSTLNTAVYSILSLNHDTPTTAGGGADFSVNTRSSASGCAFFSDASDVAADACDEVAYAAGGDATNRLLGPSATPSTALNVFSDTTGFYDSATTTGVDYFHALPKSVRNGSFTTTVTWTLASV